MKKLLAIACLLIIAIFGIILYSKHDREKTQEESINLTDNMTLITNKECDDFYISSEITNAIYNHVTNLNLDGEEDEAVINVNWYDAITFCNELSLQNELDPAYILKSDHIYFDKKADGYRLPTVKEWECAKSNEEEIDNLEWTYDYDDENEIYKVVKGGIEESNMLPSESSDNVTFRIVKNA